MWTWASALAGDVVPGDPSRQWVGVVYKSRASPFVGRLTSRDGTSRGLLQAGSPLTLFFSYVLQPQAGYFRSPRRHGRVGRAPDEERGREPQVPAGLQEGDVIQDHP